MITIPTWVFILLIILASPVVFFVATLILIMIFFPLFALRAAAWADEKMGAVEGAPDFTKKWKKESEDHKYEE